MVVQSAEYYKNKKVKPIWQNNTYKMTLHVDEYADPRQKNMIMTMMLISILHVDTYSWMFFGEITLPSPHDFM